MEKQVRNILENYEHGMSSRCVIAYVATILSNSRMTKTANGLWRTFHRDEKKAIDKVYNLAGVTLGFSVA